MYEVGTQQKCESYTGSKYRSTYYFLTINCTQVPCFEDWKERLNGFGLGWFGLVAASLWEGATPIIAETPISEDTSVSICPLKIIKDNPFLGEIFKGWRMAIETIQMDWFMGEALCWLNLVWSYFGRPALSFWWHDWFNPRWAVALPNTTTMQQDFCAISALYM